MDKAVKVSCKNCGKFFLKDKGHYTENLKLGHNFYCSKKCEYQCKTTKQTLICENCGKSFLRLLSNFSSHNYCSHSCAMIVNNKRYPRKHPVPVLKICVRCGEQYKESSGNKKYCSMKCRKETEYYTPEKLLSIIKTTFKKLGRTPTRREILKGADKACIKFFRSWNNAVAAAGFTPNRSHDNRMYKRANAKSLDGHLCDSISELLIDNWLTKNKIPHERNGSYPQTNHKADWIVNFKRQTIFIEYFGLAKDSPRYDRSISKKKTLCSQYKIKLVEIYPWDLYPKIKLEAKLNFLS